MKQCKVTLRHVIVRFFETLGLSELRWAFVTERGIVTFLFTHFTQILVFQSPSHWLCKRDATRVPSFRGCAVARKPQQQVVSCNRCKLGQTSPMEPSRLKASHQSKWAIGPTTIWLLMASTPWAPQEIPNFSGWGRQNDSTCTRHPLWVTLNEASVACITQLHSGGTKACTGRCEYNRAAPDAQPSANAKKDSLTIRAEMACKMIA